MDHLDAVVCGGGPAGLLTAIMLAQRFPTQHISLFETNPDPPLSLEDDALWDSSDAMARFYTLGVFGRGKRALEEFGVWEDVAAISQELVGGQSWRSNTTVTKNSTQISMYADLGRESIYALPRDKLVSALYQHIQQNYATRISCHFGETVTPVSFDHFDNGTTSNVLLEISPASSTTNETTRQVTTDFLIGADGAARTVANRMEQVEAEEWKDKPLWQRLTSGRPFRVTRFPDTNPRVYKTIPIQLPPDWRRDIGYSASNSNDKTGRYAVVTLPSNTKGGLCAVLLMKDDDPMAQADTSPHDLRAILDENVPIFSRLVNDTVVAAVAQKPTSAFPFFRYAGPRLHKGDRTVILGDACHSVKPYNGLGVNTAFEDVRILSDILEEHQSSNHNNNNNNHQQFYRSVVQAFSKSRAKDCKAVVNLARKGDRPDRIGRSLYLATIIMDGIFHKVCPALFTVPVPGLIHNDNYRFRDVAVRKRWERLAQVSILSLAGTLVWRLLRVLVATSARALGMKDSTVALALVGAAGALGIGQNMFKKSATPA